MNQLLQRAVVLFGHGARDPRWAEPFLALQQRLTGVLGDGLLVRLAYLELMTPSLENVIAECAAAGIAEVTVVPVFFGQGGHLRRDFPVLLEACRAAYPRVKLEATLPVGEWDGVQGAIAQGIETLFRQS
ncbi:MAG: sirohydrochlorin chelatase [Burkholderiaceae bacterium]|jgi:sirohydrochlorin cobaltochelatase